MFIKVQGTLNSETLPLLEEVYYKHAEKDKRIVVDLGSISSVDRHGTAFLKKIRDATRFIDIPAYLQLLIGKY